MQFLFENWHQFLDEKVEKVRTADSDTLAYNANKAAGLRYIDLAASLGAKNKDELHDILYDAFKKISALRENKIVRLLGAGTQGVVFELDNMHALKLFFGGHLGDRTGIAELKFYKHAYEDLHRGTAKIHTLPVYEFGKVESPGPTLDPLYYAEIAKVKTLKEYSEETARHPRSFVDLAHAILDFLKESAEPAAMNVEPQDLKNRILKTANAIEPPATKNELIGIIRMVKSLYDEYGKEIFQDLGPDNMGVLETSVPRGTISHKGIRLMDPNAKPIFILFDP